MIPYIPVLFILACYLILGMLISYFYSNHDRNQLYQVFHRYLPPQVMEEVMSNTENIQLGGTEKNVAVLFIDIRGFTGYSQLHPPQEVVKLLNSYLKLFSDIIFSYNGTLDKYLGDGLMAVFGAPLEGDDDLERAYNAALDILEKVNGEEKLSLPVGIGLAYGPVISGNIGSETRMDFTVIGDTVNRASRLEGLAGPYELVTTGQVGDLLDIKEKVSKEEVTLKGLKGKEVIYRLWRGGTQ